jgi:hypothetical protein
LDVDVTVESISQRKQAVARLVPIERYLPLPYLTFPSLLNPMFIMYSTMPYFVGAQRNLTLHQLNPVQFS